jgi:hypothetical protein
MEYPFGPHFRIVGRATHEIHIIQSWRLRPFDSVALVLPAEWRATQTDPPSYSKIS